MVTIAPVLLYQRPAPVFTGAFFFLAIEVIPLAFVLPVRRCSSAALHNVVIRPSDSEVRSELITTRYVKDGQGNILNKNRIVAQILGWNKILRYFCAGSPGVVGDNNKVKLCLDKITPPRNRSRSAF